MRYSVYKPYTMSLIKNLKKLPGVKKYGIENFLKEYLLNNEGFVASAEFIALWMEDLWKINGSATLFPDEDLLKALQSFRKFSAPGLQPRLNFPLKIFSVAFPKSQPAHSHFPSGILVFWGTHQQMSQAECQYLEQIGCHDKLPLYYRADGNQNDEWPSLSILFQVQQVGLSGRKETSAALINIHQDLFAHALAAMNLEDFKVRLRTENLRIPFSAQLSDKDQDLRYALIKLVISLGSYYAAKGDKILVPGLPDHIARWNLYTNQYFDNNSIVYFLAHSPLGELIATEELSWYQRAKTTEKSDVKIDRLH